MEVYFVNKNGSKGDSYHSEEAFKIFVNNKIHPVYITENEVSKVTINDDVLFVLHDLNSPLAVELSTKKAQIISPYVVLYLKHESKKFLTIPKRSHPIMSQCFRSLVITSTGFSQENEKEDLIKKIQSMSGLYQPQLDTGVNVLVAKNILSEKYRVASSSGIPVVTKEWVTQCWHKHQYTIKAGMDFISKYKVPIFYNLQICVSGISLEEREIVKKLVVENGGNYSGDMNKSTDVLVSNGVVSPKTNLAESINVAVVTLQWLYDSIELKYALAFNDYRISKFLRDDRYDMMLAQEANKTNADKSSGSVNEEDNKKTLYPPITTFDASDQTSAIETIQHLCNKLKSSDATFLEDLTIFVIGFGPHLLRAIRRACTLAGAVFINSQLNSSATQIIVGPHIADMATDSHVLESLRKMNDKVVSIDWLINSLETSTCCEVKHYHHNPFEPAMKRSAAKHVTEHIPDKENDKYSINKAVHDDDLSNYEPSPLKKLKISKNDDCKSLLTSTLKYLIFSGYDNPKELFSGRISSFEILDAVPTEKNIAVESFLIIKKVNTSEKLLSAIAAGIYILKESFLNCHHHTEETAKEHEWAEELKNHKNKSPVRPMTMEEQLYLSARFSRRFFHKFQLRIFENVRVLILHFSDELESVARILKAGGASITWPSHYNLQICLRKSVTIALLDMKNYKGPIDPKEKAPIEKCVSKYSQEQRLFDPKMITHFLCLLDKSSLQFFERFDQDPSILPSFLKQFLLKQQDLAYLH